MTVFYCYHKTPIGNLLLAGDGERLSRLGFPSGKMLKRHESHWKEDKKAFREVIAQLDQYFAGERKQFDLPLAQQQGSPFRQSVWQALTEIPYGKTWSYGQVAEYIGRSKKSARAVGGANAANRIPIVIPCHRVIGASCDSRGFGGGAETQAFLLDLEATHT